MRIMVAQVTEVLLCTEITFEMFDTAIHDNLTSLDMVNTYHPLAGYKDFYSVAGLDQGKVCYLFNTYLRNTFLQERLKVIRDIHVLAGKDDYTQFIANIIFPVLLDAGSIDLNHHLVTNGMLHNRGVSYEGLVFTTNSVVLTFKCYL